MAANSRGAAPELRRKKTQWSCQLLLLIYKTGYFLCAGDQATETKFAPSIFSWATFSKEFLGTR